MKSISQPLTLEPQGQIDLFRYYLNRVPEQNSPAFARFCDSVQQVINIMVAFNFKVPQWFWKQRLCKASRYGATLYDFIGTQSYNDFTVLTEVTQKVSFPHWLSIDDPYIWEFPIQVHFVNLPTNPYHILTKLLSPIAATYDLAHYHPTALSRFTNKQARFLHTDARAFLVWLLKKNLQQVNTDLSIFTPSRLIQRLTSKQHTNRQQHTDLQHIGTPGFRFKLKGISDVTTQKPVDHSAGEWLKDIPWVDNAFNLLVLPEEEPQSGAIGGYAVLPQVRMGSLGGLGRRRGLLCILSDRLGYDRDTINQEHDLPGGSELTHELCHCFQLYHVSDSDFDQPCIGIAKDTTGDRQGIPVKGSYKVNQPANIMDLTDDTQYSAIPPLAKYLYLTKGQSARARLMAQIHYPNWITRTLPWADAASWLSKRNMEANALLSSNFGSYDYQILKI